VCQLTFYSCEFQIWYFLYFVVEGCFVGLREMGVHAFKKKLNEGVFFHIAIGLLVLKGSVTAVNNAFVWVWQVHRASLCKP
jgi:hypothetical protein